MWVLYENSEQFMNSVNMNVTFVKCSRLAI